VSHISVTVYNTGSALIYDRRTLNLQQGMNVVDIGDVPSGIDASSLKIIFLTDTQGARVLEQNYLYDLVNVQALLERYLEQTIEVLLPDGDMLTGQLLSSKDSNLILRRSDGRLALVSFNDSKVVNFPALSDELQTRPTLRLLVRSEQSADQEVELAYLTSGLTWTADYIAYVAPDNKSLELSGWVTVNNTAGVSFKDVKLKFVAGNVKRIVQPQYERGQGIVSASYYAAPQGTGGAVEQSPFFDYKLYTINYPVTLDNKQTKQIEFLSVPNVRCDLNYVYSSVMLPSYANGKPYVERFYFRDSKRSVQVFVEFTADKENNLTGLPAGRLRLYQPDTDGVALLIGEEKINHTPEGEKVSAQIGGVFDIAAEVTQTDFKRPTTGELEESYEIRLRNRKSEPVEIRVPETMFRWSDWKITSSSHPYRKTDATTIEFRVTVQPDEEVVITYTAAYRWG
jgi:hypothetical protein